MVTSEADVKNELLDDKIEKTKQLFYQELARKRKSIRRNLLLFNSIVNTHSLQTLPYRARLTDDRRLVIPSQDPTVESDRDICYSVSNVQHVCMDSDLDSDDEYATLPDLKVYEPVSKAKIDSNSVRDVTINEMDSET